MSYPGNVRHGHGGGKVGLLRQDGSRCWPDMRSNWDFGGKRRGLALCAACGSAMLGRVCPCCGHSR